MRLTADKAEMIGKTVVKTKFLQLNDKRFYFPDGVDSLPFGHPNLKKIDDFKHNHGQKIEKYFCEEKEHLLSLEREALKNHPRLYLYHQILMSSPKLSDISQKDNFNSSNRKIFQKNTKR